MFIELTRCDTRLKICVAIEHITQFYHYWSDAAPNGSRVCFNGQKNHVDVLESYTDIKSLIEIFEITGE